MSRTLETAPAPTVEPKTVKEPVDVKALTQLLAAPFDHAEVKWKPQTVKGNRAMAVAYVDARVVQDRLDEVLGVEGWQDEYECLPDDTVICRLQLRLGDEWITKMDVGSPSEQPDGGDRRKAAFSDALKRAAVKFGVGRYLYRLPLQWCDFDPVKKQFSQMPKLPTRFLTLTTPAQPAPPVQSVKPRKPAEAAAALPSDGKELLRRLEAYDAKLAGQGVCAKGELLQHIARAGVKAGHGADLSAWTGAAIALAVEQTRAFETQHRSTVAAA